MKVIVVGNGMASTALVEELIRQGGDIEIHVFGKGRL